RQRVERLARRRAIGIRLVVAGQGDHLPVGLDRPVDVVSRVIVEPPGEQARAEVSGLDVQGLAAEDESDVIPLLGRGLESPLEVEPGLSRRTRSRRRKEGELPEGSSQTVDTREI